MHLLFAHAALLPARQFAIFLSEPLDGLQRWQMFMVRNFVVHKRCLQLTKRACILPDHRHPDSLPAPRQQCAGASSAPCVASLTLVGRSAVWMFYAKGVNCCAELRALLDSGPDGGSCPPVGACRGFEGTCGQIAAQFESLSILPSYPDGLADYICHAFPDDDAPVDSFIVRRRSVRLPLH